jgi:protein tyrosine/serine phosphatase
LCEVVGAAVRQSDDDLCAYDDDVIRCVKYSPMYQSSMKLFSKSRRVSALSPNSSLRVSNAIPSVKYRSMSFSPSNSPSPLHRSIWALEEWRTETSTESPCTAVARLEIEPP